MKGIASTFNNSMELAFRKAVEDGTKKDKDAIKESIFSKKTNKIEIKREPKDRKIQPAPKAGKIPVEKIQAAVESVSTKDDRNEG